MSKLNAKIEYWKDRLLDLGKRNKLINCPLPSENSRVSRSALIFKEPELLDIWKEFAENEKPIIFPLPDDDEQEDLFHRKPLPVSSKHIYVATNQTAKDTIKTLRNLKQKARVFSEEKGLNALYLAVGFLNWNDKGTKEELRSPILLIPVQISQEKLISPFFINLHDDEIIHNYALALKLFNDFGLQFPEYNSETDITEYFDRIIKTMSNPVWLSKKWTVSFEVELSLFSFLKINMYKDIEMNFDIIKNHPLIMTVAGEVPAANKSSEDSFNKDFDHDAIEPQEVLSVLDADSSQQDAIMLAKKGVSFVLQGPPGTGKSQTIANIIAELIAEGKRVLFVSEKMAAVEVVYKRLSQADLSPFCLTLHSHNAKRRDVFDQIEKTLDLAVKTAVLSKEVSKKYLQLKQQRKQLNSYAKELHSAVLPLDRSIYYANGKIAYLENYPDIAFNFKNAGKVTIAELTEYLNLFEELSLIVAASGYQNDNAWKGFINLNISNQFRQDFSERSKKLIIQIKEGILIFKKINETLGISKQWSIEDVEYITKNLSHLADSPSIQYSWISLPLPEIIKKVKQYEEDHHKRDELELIVSELNEQIEKMQNELDNLELQKNEQKIITEEIFKKWNIEKQRYINDYDEEIFNIDAGSVFKLYRTKYRSFFGKFRPSYWINRKVIFSCLRKKSKLSFNETLELLDKLETAQRIRIDYETQNTAFFNLQEKIKNIRSNLLEVKTKFKKNKNSLDKTKKNLEENKTYLSASLNICFDDKTDYALLINKLEWTVNSAEFVKKEGFSSSEFAVSDLEKFVNKICLCDADTILQCKKLFKQLIEWDESAKNVLIEFASLFEQQQKIIKKPLDEFLKQVDACSSNLKELEYYIDFCKIKNKCLEMGIGSFLEKIEKNNLNSKDITGAFEKCFYRAWIDAVLPKYTSVNDFRSHKHEEIIKSYREHDKIHLEISRDSLLEKLIKRLPLLNSFTSEYDEIGILKRELKKMRKLMPTRKLMAALPNIIQILKPCMMLSPLSVSTYLSGANYIFDTVIFDEASQIRTEDAVCSLFRAKQAIIAGDSKQLPPSDFFSSSISANETFDEDSETDDIGAFDSLLDEANLLPSKMLLWHYRSRHEDLIVFSNKKIYNKKLTTFPSSIETDQSEFADDLGVQYIYVHNGFYDRGGNNGNHAEAEMVAQLAFEHFEKYPNRSLGIIAFGETQQNAILDALLRKRKEMHKNGLPALETFFNEENDEALFIKNLETVQGDERDTIIFSIGYAPDKNGKFIMNFGPLNRAGGERRLNVAITRARYNVKLVGSIKPKDIDTDRTSSLGPKLLKQYIDFAINGNKIFSDEITEKKQIIDHDSYFEKAIFNFLIENGYDAVTNVGSSDYKIDIAVRSPNSRSFAIGIECDGESYHCARTARERDRLRQTILESMGWKMYRVWSTDWIKDSKTEGKKLLEVVEKALQENCVAKATCAAKSETKNEFLKITARTDTSVKLPNPKHHGYEPRDIPAKEFENEMIRIISLSYGIFKEGLFKETALRYSWERQGPVIKDCLEIAFQNLIRKNKIIVREIDGKTSITLSVK
ncbi:MAG: DUF4011 domain-containing protein [Treponema sp.]|nr:DUF4011 domain-containing protein [Treponema sp.]MCL2251318.1 DUF4011 domain-containing protein [Treponema sp.]